MPLRYSMPWVILTRTHTHAFAHAHQRAIQKHIDTQTHTRKPKLILSNRDRHSATQLKKWNT